MYTVHHTITTRMNRELGDFLNKAGSARNSFKAGITL